ncbi:hypothetical protein [Bradyrhizobium sp. AZCC 2289]|uniref:hypothetical protein n=1 Tax=Bradyrhizobium sp. AZCC 2289 TaxID=3117026 RepID=UPI002FF26C25
MASIPKSQRNPYVALGLTAIRQALADANIEWPAVESTYVATALLGMASGRPMLRHLGAMGAPLLHIENASASGSTAFRQACIEVDPAGASHWKPSFASIGFGSDTEGSIDVTGGTRSDQDNQCLSENLDWRFAVVTRVKRGF